MLKRYNPVIDSDNIGKGVIIMRLLSIPFLVIAIVTRILDISNASRFFLLMCIPMLWLDFIWFMQKMAGGYKLSDKEIIFWRNCKKNRVEYENIKYIFIVNACTNNVEISSLPWVAIIGGKATGVVEYCMHTRGENNRLFNTDIENILVKNQEIKSNYGFLWNSKEMYKILKGYKGDYYIAKSVMKESEEYKQIYERYDIKDRVHIIEDI